MSDPRALLTLEVPVVVVLGERTMRTSDLLALRPGAILELPKRAGDPLDLLLNNRAIGSGEAVKVGEKFGIRIATIGTRSARLRTAAEGRAADNPPADELRNAA